MGLEEEEEEEDGDNKGHIPWLQAEVEAAAGADSKYFPAKNMFAEVTAKYFQIPELDSGVSAIRNLELVMNKIQFQDETVADSRISGYLMNPSLDLEFDCFHY